MCFPPTHNQSCRNDYKKLAESIAKDLHTYETSRGCQGTEAHHKNQVGNAAVIFSRCENCLSCWNIQWGQTESGCDANELHNQKCVPFLFCLIPRNKPQFGVWASLVSFYVTVLNFRKSRSQIQRRLHIRNLRLRFHHMSLEFHFFISNMNNLH
jgi:hypothetical protein